MSLLTGEPKFDLHHAALGALLELICLDNDPVNSGVGGSSPNGPESREPGRQNAPGSVKAAIRALERCEKELARIHGNARVRERHKVPAQSIGGKDVSAPEGIKIDTHRRKVGVNVTAGHLVTKHGDLVEGRTE